MDIKDVRAGDVVVTDDGFTCLHDKRVLKIQEDDCGLFIPCAEGKHYLSGQTDDDGQELVGLTIIKTGDCAENGPPNLRAGCGQ